MKKSVYDLAFEFIEGFYGERECDVKRDIIDFMKDLLHDGFTDDEITARWQKWLQDNPNQIPKFARLYKQGPGQLNLLKPGRFYYHNTLQIVPGPPVRDFDYNTGEITKMDEDYYLEMRASLTVDQLVQYYLDQFGLKSSENDRKRYGGAFRYLLKNHDVEVILFMIDVASNLAYAEDKAIVGVLDLKDYEREAVVMRAEKMTEIRQAGDEKIVTRKRILSSRGRCEEAEREIHSEHHTAS